jgi:hypothetical protein
MTARKSNVRRGMTVKQVATKTKAKPKATGKGAIEAFIKTTDLHNVAAKHRAAQKARRKKK